MRLLIRAADDSAKVPLLRATAASGNGRIRRFDNDLAVSDEQILAALRETELEKVVTRAGGFDAERNWNLADVEARLDDYDAVLEIAGQRRVGVKPVRGR